MSLGCFRSVSIGILPRPLLPTSTYWSAIVDPQLQFEPVCVRDESEPRYRSAACSHQIALALALPRNRLGLRSAPAFACDLLFWFWFWLIQFGSALGPPMVANVGPLPGPWRWWGEAPWLIPCRIGTTLLVSVPGAHASCAYAVPAFTTSCRSTRGGRRDLVGGE